MNKLAETVYFISDLHLGTPTEEASREREKKFIRWLDEIAQQGDVLYIIGDLFDFWHEYGTVVPKGFVRTLGKLAELADGGKRIIFFPGNHDQWVRDYFQGEIGIEVVEGPVIREHSGKTFFIGHGDGLGPGDYGYKRLKKVFRNPFARAAFRWIHPDIAIPIAHYFSKQSRFAAGEPKEEVFKGEDNEWLYQYSLKKSRLLHADYFIFGHRHLPLDMKVGENSRYINLGDWLSFYTYAHFDGKQVELLRYETGK